MAIQDGTEYETTIEALAERYKPRAMALLTRIRDLCREVNLTTDDEPFDMSCDDYKYSLRVWRMPEHADEDCIDVGVEISEARAYGDGGKNTYGVNFGVDIVEWGGRILGGLAPYNYTEECWVDARDTEAVEERWSIIEDADLSEIPALIAKVSV